MYDYLKKNNTFRYDNQNGEITSFSVSKSELSSNEPSLFKAELKTFSQIKEEVSIEKNKPSYFEVKGTITMIKYDGEICYNACPNCQKKLIESNGIFTCNKCSKQIQQFQPRYIKIFLHKFPFIIIRYIFSLSATDYTGTVWLGCFNDAGKIILNKDASEMVQLKETNVLHFFKKIFYFYL